MTDQPEPRGISHATMRAADSDRDAVAEILATAHAEGRLDLVEYQHRLERAMGATTLGELEPLTTDLPNAQPSAAVDLAEQSDPRSWMREWVDEWRTWLGAAVIMVGIWAVTSVVSGEFLPFWPLIPLGIWAAINVASVIFGSSDSDR